MESFCESHHFFMRQALKEARAAYDEEEVPVGAVIVCQAQVIARAHNQVERLKDPTAHAEMIAITQASATLGAKWLHRCRLYVTLEPCAMCAGALVLSRLDEVIIAASDPKTGACGSVLNIPDHPALNHRVSCRHGLLARESQDLLQRFFRSRRQ